MIGLKVCGFSTLHVHMFDKFMQGHHEQILMIEANKLCGIHPFSALPVQSGDYQRWPRNIVSHCEFFYSGCSFPITIMSDFFVPSMPKDCGYRTIFPPGSPVSTGWGLRCHCWSSIMAKWVQVSCWWFSLENPCWLYCVIWVFTLLSNILYWGLSQSMIMGNFIDTRIMNI